MRSDPSRPATENTGQYSREKHREAGGSTDRAGTTFTRAARRAKKGRVEATRPATAYFVAPEQVLLIIVTEVAEMVAIPPAAVRPDSAGREDSTGRDGSVVVPPGLEPDVIWSLCESRPVIRTWWLTCGARFTLPSATTVYLLTSAHCGCSSSAPGACGARRASWRGRGAGVRAGGPVLDVGQDEPSAAARSGGAGSG